MNYEHTRIRESETIKAETTNVHGKHKTVGITVAQPCQG